MARVVRGQVLTLRSSAFVESARAQGASAAWIVRHHLAPNVLPIAVVYLALSLPSVILYEAFLSFLGLGVEAPGVSWGVLAADGADVLGPLASYWWLALFPSLAIGGTLLALGLVGDGLRDALDLKRGAA
jgi:oligopeptide transport system permease protein